MGSFGDYFTPGSTVTQAEFDQLLDRQALYVFIIFLVRFFLNYINKFALRMIGIRISAALRSHYLSCLFMQTVHVLDSSTSCPVPTSPAATACRPAVQSPLRLSFEALLRVLDSY